MKRHETNIMAQERKNLKCTWAGQIIHKEMDNKSNVMKCK